MREKPIIFSTPMVEALLNTKPEAWPARPIDIKKPFKSMTRRVIKPQPDEDGIAYTTIEGFQTAPPGEEIWAQTEEGESVQLKPRFEEGDLLWVRETWRVSHVGLSGNDEWAHIVYKCGKSKSIDIHSNEESLFYASKAKWQSPLFMPRKAARLYLRVKSFGIQRLNNISEKDALHEGVERCNPCASLHKNPKITACGGGAHPIVHCVDCDKYINPTFKAGFAFLWESINAKRGYPWKSNPWVWVYEFMRVENE